MKITLGGTTHEVSDEQQKQIEAILSKDDVKVWTPDADYPYHTIYADGSVNQTTWDNDSTDRMRLAFGNCWRTEEPAKAHAERLRAFNHLWQIAEAIGRSKNGDNRWTTAWYIDGKIFAIENTNKAPRRDDFDFPTYEACERFIKTGQQWLDILYPKV